MLWVLRLTASKKKQGISIQDYQASPFQLKIACRHNNNKQCLLDFTYFTQNEFDNEMSHKKKGQLTTATEWAKHLRKYLRRQFWKGERKAVKNMIRKDLDENNYR